MNYLIRTSWWKWLSMALLVYTVIGGLLFTTPRLAILNETIRVLHFHVPMWFTMIFLFIGSVVFAVRHLRSESQDDDMVSNVLAQVGMVFAILGLLTGMLWAEFTWGEPWSNDPKQNGTAICMLVYAAYFVLRGSLSDDQQRGRIAGVYNIFAFAAMIPLLFILPRMSDSLHPGNGGNPGFNAYDLDSNLRMVFYPAVLGWALLGYWIATLIVRINRVESVRNDD